jgi:hypothetical protein
MKFTAIMIFFFSFLVAEANEFVLVGGYTKTRTNISGQNALPFYEGTGLSGDLEYLIPYGENKALSIYGTFLSSNQDNTANNTVVEKLKINYLGAGLKFSFGSFFTSLSIGKVKFEDTITGTINKTIAADSTGYELGMGFRFRMTRLLGFTFGVQGMKSSISPSNGSGFYADYGIWQIRGMVGLTFILPSLPSNEFNFSIPMSDSP